ncbi:F-box protein [Tripterygium wilfordii]|uniref:F-box protein n=2 Tax=Tripterygium wilfordii TaxID=458696 RepID=A0A7J7CTN2_TRIWF|nr:F-box protein [Tripterygium wilfordii]
MTTSCTVAEGGATTTIAAIHPDILGTHILTRFDGPTLASAACTCAQFCALASREELWTNICLSTWPSTDTARMQKVISTFPDGPRSFFSDSYPLLTVVDPTGVQPVSHGSPSELISAVDIFYREELVFSKVEETETESGWFRCSPFRIDLLDPKDTVPTGVPQPDAKDTCGELADELTLSWIVIDPVGRRAMNLSSHKPVSVQRHWLSGEVHARFAAILSGERGSSSELVRCGIVVTFGNGTHEGGMHVREVSLQVEDMDGTNLNGKDSLWILQKALEGKKGRRIRKSLPEEGRRRHEEFLEMKRERKERKLRAEATFDMLCVSFGILSLAFLGLYILWRL